MQQHQREKKHLQIILRETVAHSG